MAQVTQDRRADVNGEAGAWPVLLGITSFSMLIGRPLQ